jgi:hypothetical protein
MDLFRRYEEADPWLVLGVAVGGGLLISEKPLNALLLGAGAVLTHPKLNLLADELLGFDVPFFSLVPTPDTPPGPDPTDPDPNPGDPGDPTTPPNYIWDGKELTTFGTPEVMRALFISLDRSAKVVSYNIAEPRHILNLTKPLSSTYDGTRALVYNYSGYLVPNDWLAAIIASNTSFCVDANGSRVPSVNFGMLVAANYGVDSLGLSNGIMNGSLGLSRSAAEIPMNTYVTGETVDLVTTPANFDVDLVFEVLSTTTVKHDGGGTCWDSGTQTTVYAIYPSEPSVTVLAMFQRLLTTGKVRVAVKNTSNGQLALPDMERAGLAVSAFLKTYAGGNLSNWFAQYGFSRWAAVPILVPNVSDSYTWSNYICDGQIP